MDRPTASPAYWPYREHRNMAQVMADERRGLSYQEGIAQTCIKCGAKPGCRCKTPAGNPYEGLHAVRRCA